MTEITRPFAPAPDKSTKPATDYSKGKKTETYYFPRRVLLQLPSLERVMFEMGPQEVPEEILNHPASMEWLKNNGAKPHVVGRSAAPPLEKLPEITDHHVRFLQQRGYPTVRTIADAIRFVTNLSASDKAGFFKDAGEWEGPKSNETLVPNTDPTANVQSEAAIAGADAGKPAEDPNASADQLTEAPADKSGDSADDKSGKAAENSGDAQDKPGDKTAAANQPADDDNNSKAAAQGAASGKPAGDSGKPKGKSK